jgi:hypothetical protein
LDNHQHHQRSYREIWLHGSLDRQRNDHLGRVQRSDQLREHRWEVLRIRRNSYSYAESDCNCDSDSDLNSYCNVNTNCNTHAYAYIFSDTNSQTYANTEITPDSSASPIARMRWLEEQN